MTASTTSFLCRPANGEKINEDVLGYMRQRNRNRAHALVLREFKAASISQAELARRLGKSPEVVCRLLGGPGNWGLDTLSDLLWALSASEVSYRPQRPLEEPRRNQRDPYWLEVEEEQRLGLIQSKSAQVPNGSGSGNKFVVVTARHE